MSKPAINLWHASCYYQSGHSAGKRATDNMRHTYIIEYEIDGQLEAHVITVTEPEIDNN